MARDRNDDRVVVAYDLVVHGLAALWKHYADEQGLAPDPAPSPAGVEP